MKPKHALASAVLAALAAGCARIDYVPPANVPVAAAEQAPEQFPPAPEGAPTSWRPYSSGPLQAASPGLRLAEARPVTVERKPLPVLMPGNSARAGGSAGVTPAPATWRAPQPPQDSAFRDGVSSEWAKAYVPASLRDEFGIFARKAAADEQARMVTPTGEVYAAMVTRRNGPCSTVEVTVTDGGDLPVLSRGLVEVCRAK